MKVKKITIHIKSLDEALDEFVDTAEKIKKGHKIKSKSATYVADAETARAIFTDSRIKIIQFLKEKNPKSIYGLAKLLNRDFKNVYEDVMFLAEVGIIGIKESKDGRHQKQPILLSDQLLFDIAA